MVSDHKNPKPILFVDGYEEATYLMEQAEYEKENSHIFKKPFSLKESKEYQFDFAQKLLLSFFILLTLVFFTF